jgi:hypothetical protein
VGATSGQASEAVADKGKDILSFRVSISVFALPPFLPIQNFDSTRSG